MTPYTHDDGDLVNACRALHDEYAAGTLNRTEYLAAFQQLDAQTGVACDNCGATPATIQRTQGVNWCSRCTLAEHENRAIERTSSVLSWLFTAGLLLLILAFGALAGWAIVAGVL
jgi:hypothetical protein